MAPSKLAILSVFVALVFRVIRADDVPVEREVIGSNGLDSSALKIELDQLKSKIESLG